MNLFQVVCNLIFEIASFIRHQADLFGGGIRPLGWGGERGSVNLKKGILGDQWVLP